MSQQFSHRSIFRSPSRSKELKLAERVPRGEGTFSSKPHPSSLSFVGQKARESWKFKYAKPEKKTSLIASQLSPSMYVSPRQPTWKSQGSRICLNAAARICLAVCKANPQGRPQIRPIRDYETPQVRGQHGPSFVLPKRATRSILAIQPVRWCSVQWDSFLWQTLQSWTSLKITFKQNVGFERDKGKHSMCPHMRVGWY